ncbi:hypothetical protein AAF712_009090 [Marasmius tenuissimus]|uniref:Uncharacterized protein n=1 Tax=Marasmius tenuissimus TaxID=585030 RepID=A0ABR2ZQQ9_9AGAR
MRESPPTSNSETEPLLGQSTASAEATARERFYSYETRWACTVDALTKHGKLPSQEQANKILKGLATTLNGLDANKGRKGTITNEARVLLVDLKETVDALERWGEEKNYDSKLQNMIHNLRLLSQSPSISESLYSLLPSLSSSVTLRTILLNALLILTYNITRRVSSVASTVESVAQTVETAMEKADTVVRGVEEVAQGIELAAGGALDGVAASSTAQEGHRGKEKEKEAHEAVNSVEEGVRRVEEGVTQMAGGAVKESEPVNLNEAERRKLVIDTLREALVSAHQTHPGDNALDALRGMLTLGEGYIRSATSQLPQRPPRVPSPTFKVKVTPTLEPELPSSLRDTFSALSTDPFLSTSTATKDRDDHDPDDQELLWLRDLESRILADLKVMLERVAGDRSVDGLVDRFKQVVQDVSTRPDEAQEGANEDGSSTGKEKAVQDDQSTQHLLQSTFTILRRAAEDASYVEQGSEEGFTKDMDALAEEWGSLIDEEDEEDGERTPRQARQQIEKERDHLRIFVRELSSFLNSLENDKTTQRLVRAFRHLQDDFTGYLYSSNTDVASTAARIGAQQLHLNLIRDVIGYIVPKIIGNAITFSSPHSSSQSFTLPLPLPRVELKAPQTGVVEGVVDMRGMVVDVSVQDEHKRRSRPWWRFWNRDKDREEEYWWGDRIRDSRLEDSFYSTASISGSMGESAGGDEGGDGDHEHDSWLAQFLTPTSVRVKRSEEIVIDFSSSLEIVDEDQRALEVERDRGYQVNGEEIDERTPLLHHSTSASSGTGLQKTNTHKSQIETSTRTTSRAHITIDGLFVELPPSPVHQSRLRHRDHTETERTISFENISFYVDYVLWKVLGYRDEGIVDLDVTFRSTNADGGSGTAGVVEMDVEFDLGSSSAGDDDVGPPTKPIQIHSLVLSLPSADILDLDLSLSSNRHPLLTSLLLEPIAIPLAKWAMRKEVERAAGETLRVVLEEAGNRAVVLSQVLGGYGGKGWWDVIMGGGSGSHSDDDKGSDEEETQTKTDVDVGLRGIDVRITSPTDDQEESQSHEPEGGVETEPQLEIAVGIAPQIIDSSKAAPEQPVHLDIERAIDQTAQEVSNDVRDEVQEVVEEAAAVTGTVRGILKGAKGGVKGNGGNGTCRKQVRYQESGSFIARKGEGSEPGEEPWRSDVFDYW